jgi:two-component system CheB/CheR fusion protein
MEEGEQMEVAPCARKGAESQRFREKSFPIVGVGASAGGLEAYTQLLTHLPANIGMAFVIVQHLAPGHESMLCDILSKSTKMPISEVQNGMQVKPDHGYVIPANVNMTILNGVLNLRPRISEPHTPINTFFISLAEDQKNKAIGVLLSGTGTDGTEGMKAINAEGGITFAQNQESAKYYSMPQSAIAAGCVDVVLAPKEIARELVRISRHPHVTYAKPKVLPRGRDDLKEIFTMLKSSSGVDFTHYKPPTIKRRITRRMIIHKLEKTQDYVKYLRDSPEELEALFHDLLISVTGFFRKPETFQILKDKVFPISMKNKSPEKTIKIWVPGCSTGEEAYSIAISLREFLDNMATDIPVKIFGTDVNEAGIAKARSGIYAKSITDNVSQERLRRFFDRVDRGYRVNTIIRDMCIFAKQDVTKDPPFSDLDLISCCNVLIYFEPVLQKRVMPIFHYALNPTGFLMLGPSESISSFSNLFTPLDKKHKIFSKKPGPVKVTFSFEDLDLYEKR